MRIMPSYPFLIAQSLKAVVKGLKLTFLRFSQYLGHLLPLEVNRPKSIANFPLRPKLNSVA